MGSLFMANQRFSIGRVQIIWGMYYLFWILLTGRSVSDPLIWAFLTAIVILAAGAAVLLLEARLARMPAHLRAWLATLEPDDSPQDRAANSAQADSGATAGVSRNDERDRSYSPAAERGIPDFAVLQLGIGVAAVPVAALIVRYDGWRILAVAAISEIVYLAYLGARIVRVAELAEVARESRRLEIRERLCKHSASAEGEPPSDQLKRLELAQRALRARGREIWRDMGWTFDSPPALSRPRLDQKAAPTLPSS